MDTFALAIAIFLAGLAIGFFAELAVDVYYFRPRRSQDTLAKRVQVEFDAATYDALDTQHDLLARLETLRAEESLAITRLEGQVAHQLDVLTRLAELMLHPGKETGWLAAGDEVVTTLQTNFRMQNDMLAQFQERLGYHTSALNALQQQLATAAGALHDIQAIPPQERVVITEERVVTRAQDRLSDIRGIGPVYAGKLHEANIHTFKQLAALTPDELLTVIGPTIRRIEPWIEQAQMLAAMREKAERVDEAQ